MQVEIGLGEREREKEGEMGLVQMEKGSGSKQWLGS